MRTSKCEPDHAKLKNTANIRRSNNGTLLVHFPTLFLWLRHTSFSLACKEIALFECCGLYFLFAFFFCHDCIYVWISVFTGMTHRRTVFRYWAHGRLLLECQVQWLFYIQRGKTETLIYMRPRYTFWLPRAAEVAACLMEAKSKHAHVYEISAHVKYPHVVKINPEPPLRWCVKPYNQLINKVHRERILTWALYNGAHV